LRAIVGASEKGRAGGVGGDVFDVRVVGFAGGAARTREALQELFGLDRESAQRLLDNVPMVVRRAAPANEAHDYVEALRGIGAQVALERPEKPAAGERSILAKPPPVPAARRAPPPPPKAANPRLKAPPPVPRDAEPLPKPIMRQLTADLEFDLAASGGSGEPAVGAAEPKSAARTPNKRSAVRRNEIEFAGGTNATLELDVEARAPERGPDKPPEGLKPAAGRPTRTGVVVSGDQPVMRSSPTEAGRGPGPMSRAAVVTKTGPASLAPARRRRTIALLRVFGAVCAAAGGVWFESSIVYGNANIVSVLVHAAAIYQCGVGLRGMLP
jgi:hypothetical protein